MYVLALKVLLQICMYQCVCVRTRMFCFKSVIISTIPLPCLTKNALFWTRMLQVASVVTAIKTGLGLAALVSIADVPHIAFNRRSFVVYLIDHSFDAALLATMCACITYFE